MDNFQLNIADIKIMWRIKALWVLALLTNTCYTLAQHPKYSKVKVEQNVIKETPNKQKYQYQQFLPGVIATTSGTLSKGKFNYNLLLGEMHFIQRAGDTLAIANEFNIKQIVIGQDTFYYDVKFGYLQIKAHYSSVKLAAQQKLTILNNEKETAYGQSSAVSAIRQYSLYTDNNGQIRKLENKGNVLLTTTSAYFLIDKNRHSYIANKATVLELYKKHKNKIATFLKENKVDFHKEEDLNKLLQYCSKLT